MESKLLVADRFHLIVVSVQEDIEVDIPILDWDTAARYRDDLPADNDIVESSDAYADRAMLKAAILAGCINDLNLYGESGHMILLDLYRDRGWLLVNVPYRVGDPATWIDEFLSRPDLNGSEWDSIFEPIDDSLAARYLDLIRR